MQEKNLEIWFHTMANHYVEAQVLFHLNQAGIFLELQSGARLHSTDLAKKLNLHEPTLISLLDFIVGVDNILQRDDLGAYSLTSFGKEICERFGRKLNGINSINLFDVRVGSYGPVWAALPKLLSQNPKEREEAKRLGSYAENALHNIASKFYPAIASAIRECSANALVELGASTYPLEFLKLDFPKLKYYAFDRDDSLLAKISLVAKNNNFSQFHTVKGDFFQSDWKNIQEKNSLFFSIHFHEFLASGIPAFQAALKNAKQYSAGSHLLVLEQTLPNPKSNLALHEVQYAHSNVLIHHLIGNGKILSTSDWISTIQDCGFELKKQWRTAYLGYEAFLFSF
jgi:hypothetical protein